MASSRDQTMDTDAESLTTTPNSCQRPHISTDFNVICEMWGISNDPDFVTKFEGSLKQDFHQMHHYLCGNVDILQGADLLKFVDLKPEETFGKFLTTLFVADHVRLLPLPTLVELYSTGHFPAQYQEVIKQITLKAVMENVRATSSLSSFANDIPVCLRDFIGIDCLIFLSSEMGISSAESALITTSDEEKCIFDIRDQMTKFLRSDLRSKTLKALDNNYPQTDRLGKWFDKIDKFIRGLSVHKSSRV